MRDTSHVEPLLWGGPERPVHDFRRLVLQGLLGLHACKHFLFSLLDFQFRARSGPIHVFAKGCTEHRVDALHRYEPAGALPAQNWLERCAMGPRFFVGLHLLTEAGFGTVLMGLPFGQEQFIAAHAWRHVQFYVHVNSSQSSFWHRCTS